MSTNSKDSPEVPAIIFEKFLGATGLRNIQMGEENHV